MGERGPQGAASTGAGEPGPARRGRRWPLVVAAVVVLALGAGVGYALGHHAASPHASAKPTTTSPATPTSPSTSSPSHATTTAGGVTTVPEGGTLSAALPLVACRTTYALATPPATTQPASSTITMLVPADLAHQLAVYTDGRGFMKLVAPTGWNCLAQYGADGSGGVVVYPPNEQLPSSGTSFASAAGLAEAVVGSQTSACVGCTEGQACPYFPTAASAYSAAFDRPCPTAVPKGEEVTSLNSTIVAILDPSGVKGVGVPSGGANPANSVMTYVPTSDDGSWLATCTLPADEHSVCTAVLNAFENLYGGQ